MQKKLVFAAGATVLSAGVLAIALLSPGTENPNGAQPDASYADTAGQRPGATQAGNVEAEVPAGDQALAAEDASSRPASVLDVVGSSFPYDPTDPLNPAQSEEDAAWLHRNGYLPPFANNYLRRASLDELKPAAEQDLRVQVMLAYRMALAGVYGEQPIVMLKDAAARGSIFALETLGDVHMSVLPYRNPSLGIAYYQLAIRRGDFAVASKKLMATEKMSGQLRLLADLYAEALWMDLQALRRQRGLPQFAEADMRPGFAQYLAGLQQSALPKPAEGPGQQ